MQDLPIVLITPTHLVQAYPVVLDRREDENGHERLKQTSGEPGFHGTCSNLL